jgi:predicted ArsR family transcriptional regulator
MPGDASKLFTNLLLYGILVNMQIRFEDNPTRQKILLLLRKRGGMSNEELSRQLQITPMGVRQHLLSLEKKGFIAYDTIRHGIGRPNFVYKLTEEADECFPKKYDEFALEILREIESREGRGKIDQLFQWRKDRMLAAGKELFGVERAVREKVSIMAEMLQEKGYIVDFGHHGNNKYVIRQYNCPISAVSRAYPEACRYELELYRDLFGPAVERSQCLSDHGVACEYIIPEA